MSGTAQDSPHSLRDGSASFDSHITSSTCPPGLTSASSSAGGTSVGGPSHHRYSSSAMTISSRGRPSIRSTGPALGLEEEVEFGSDEDLLENVGEIQLDDVGWYPGQPDPYAKGKGKHGSHHATTTTSSNKDDPTKRKNRFLNKARERAARGLGDAVIVSMDEMSNSSSIDLERSETGRSSLLSKSHHGHGITSVDDVSSMATASEAGSLRNVKRDKTVKKTMFSKLFKNKKDEPRGISSATPSSRPSSILEKHDSRPQSLRPATQAPRSSLPSTTTTSRSSQALPQLPPKAPVNSSAVAQPPVPRRSTTPAGGMAMGPPALPQNMSDVSALSSRSTSNSTQVSVTSPLLSPPKETDSDHLIHFLLPDFPTSLAALESTTIISTMVMRRLGGLDSKNRASLRPGTGSSSGSAGKKPIWQSHQLVLTSFRLNDSRRPSLPLPVSHNTKGSASGTRTMAHLHLFNLQGSKSKPGSPVSVVQSSAQRYETNEAERLAIDRYTTAGVWDHAEEDGRRDAPEKGRRWVMRIRWEGQDEWLCDMPNRDTLFEWIKQIKTYAIVMRAESQGLGDQIRQSLSQGSSIDLALELEMLQKGLRGSVSSGSTPQLVSAPLPRTGVHGGGNEEVMGDDDAESSGSEGVSPTDGSHKARRGSRRFSESKSAVPSSGSARMGRRSSLIRPAFTDEMPPPVPAPNVPLPAAPTSSSTATANNDHSLQVSVDGVPQAGVGSGLAQPLPIQPTESTPITLESATNQPSSTITGTPGTATGLTTPSESEPTPGLYTPSLSESAGTGTTSTFLDSEHNDQGGRASAQDRDSKLSIPTTLSFPTPPESVPVPNAATGKSPMVPVTMVPLNAGDGARQKPRFADVHIDGVDTGSIAETASITSSATASTAARRRRAKAQAVDLMAEFSNRSEVNFETPEEEVLVPDESRSRKIRFAG